jgi:glycosyltransferase involved in cell wall biosynthesis
MRILMLGWEFPPFISGGLGTACYGLTCAMEHLDLDIVMLLPTNTQNLDGVAAGAGGTKLSTDNLSHVVFRTVPYKLPNPYHRVHPIRVFGTGQPGGYDGNLIERVYQYANRCIELVKSQTFDVIHAHDWVTFPAAVALSTELQKPLVVHVHATEIDRSGEHINHDVYEIERRGMEAASAVIAVSHYTASILVSRYGVPSDKIHVVHNGINHKQIAARPFTNRREATVLFMGRITSQKGPEFFVRAAEQVLKKYDKVKFVIAGWGDLAPNIIEMVAARRLGSKILFTGFLRGGQVDTAYRMSDLFVMPSVSEPFGLAALEAVQYRLPVILSKTTGVGEVLRQGALKVDFWDTNKMAEQIVDVLRNPDVARRLCTSAIDEIQDLTWDAAARKCVSVYNAVSRQAVLIEHNN